MLEDTEEYLEIKAQRDYLALLNSFYWKFSVFYKFF